MIRRLILMAVTGLLMGEVLFAQPASAQQTASDRTVVQGSITNIIDELHYSVLVEEDPSDPADPPLGSPTDKGSFTVTEQTEILRRQGDELVSATKQDLSVGQLVEATYTGVVGATYPSSGDAGRIVILEEVDRSCSLPEGCSLSGDDSHETLTSGSGPDYVIGGRGHDALYGVGGGDWLDGGAGDDLVRGGDGDDLVDGGSGHDAVIGGAGNDYVTGYLGNDLIVGDNRSIGNDFIYAADGWFDIVLGGPGYDVCVVDPWDDVSGCEEAYTE